MTMNILTDYPFPAFSRLGSACAFAAAVAVNAAYVGGAFATATLQNTTTKVIIIPKDGVVITADQRFEVVAFPTYSGDVGQLNGAQTNMIAAVRGDAFETVTMHPLNDVLRPGETVSFRFFNRAPAAATAMSITVYQVAVEERVFAKLSADQRQMLEELLPQ